MSWRGSVRRVARTTADRLRSLRGVAVNGQHFHLPFAPPLSIEEPWMADVLARLDGFQGAFVDIGANLGQTLLHLRSFGRERRYLGFEPNVHCAAYAMQLAAINGFAHTQLIPAACAFRIAVEQLHFFQDSDYDTSASLVEDFRKPGSEPRSSFVVTAPLEYCLARARVDRVGIVKIDVEGFEATVLGSMEPLLAKDRPAIVIEILPVYSTENNARLAETRRVEQAVTRSSYRLLRIAKAANGRLAGFEPIAEIAVHGDMSKADYVLCPSERAD